jgi:hypothetical protein
MRKFEFWATSALLLATGTLLPMAALEPVAEAATPAALPGACADGSAHLAMGCASVQL